MGALQAGHKASKLIPVLKKCASIWRGHWRIFAALFILLLAVSLVTGLALRLRYLWIPLVLSGQWLAIFAADLSPRRPGAFRAVLTYIFGFSVLLLLLYGLSRLMLSGLVVAIMKDADKLDSPLVRLLFTIDEAVIYAYLAASLLLTMPMIFSGHSDTSIAMTESRQQMRAHFAAPACFFLLCGLIFCSTELTSSVARSVVAALALTCCALVCGTWSAVLYRTCMNEGMDTSKLLTRYRRVAVVGISANPSRPSHWIATYLQENGYEVTGVNPGLPAVPGIKVVATIEEAPQPLEIVDVFRSPDAIPEVVEQVSKLKPAVLWLQPGAENPEAEQRARSLGMTVVSGNCIYQDHQALTLAARRKKSV